MRKIALFGMFLLFPAWFVSAEAPLGWPEVIDHLAIEKSQAETCVGLLKSRGDAAEIQNAKITYGAAKAQIDGAIAGLIALLGEGGRPGSLLDVQDQFAASGIGLRQICEAATKDTKPGQKGVWDEIAKAAVEPLVKALSAAAATLWAHYVDHPAAMERLERENKKTQLEAARWPEFADISKR